jgi:hypothetical protein
LLTENSNECGNKRKGTNLKLLLDPNHKLKKKENDYKIKRDDANLSSSISDIDP